MSRRPEDNPEWRRLQETQGKRPPLRAVPPQPPAPRRYVEPEQTEIAVEPNAAARRGDPKREAPRESGKRVATFPRPGRGGKRDTELRVTLDTYEGHDFVSVRLWERGFAASADTFFPTPRGVSLRRGELRAAIEALTAAARELGVSLTAEEASR